MNPSSAASEGLATAALLHCGCCLMLPDAGRGQKGLSLLHTGDVTSAEHGKMQSAFQSLSVRQL